MHKILHDTSEAIRMNKISNRLEKASEKAIKNTQIKFNVTSSPKPRIAKYTSFTWLILANTSSARLLPEN